MPRLSDDYLNKHAYRRNSGGALFGRLILIILLLQTSVLIYAKKSSLKELYHSFNNTQEVYEEEVDDNKEVEEAPIKTSISDNTTDNSIPEEKVEDKIPDDVKLVADDSISKDDSKEEQKLDLGRKVRISIMNGCRVSGLAGRWKERLIKKDYDVREVGNTKRIHDESIVISRIDDIRFAYALADLMGINRNKVILQKNKNIVDIDVTLVIGKDYREIKKKFDINKKN